MSSKVTSIKKALDILSEASADQKEEIQKMITNEYKDIKNIMSEIKPKLEETASTLQKNISETVEQLNHKANELKDEVGRQTKENPWKAVGIASAVGFFLGVAMKNRK